MSSTNLSIKYRPVRIGFLVREGNIDDLVTVAGINTLLWGGIYNPIIPVSNENKFSEQLMNLFSVDVLFPVNDSREINLLMSKYEYLRDPMLYARNIFYEDWNSKKKIIGFLDSLNIIRYYWEEKDFKNMPKGYKSDCALVKWEDSDDLRHLFSILFGYFPKSYDLKVDFEQTFLHAMRPKEIKISKINSIPTSLVTSFYPIEFTKAELSGRSAITNENGIYLGDETDFNDLVEFWNLRASGLTIQFLTQKDTQRFKEFITRFIKILDKAPNRNPNIEDHIIIYHRAPDEQARQIVKNFQTKKHILYHPCRNRNIWNGLNIKPTNFYFHWGQYMGNLEKSYNRHKVSINLPEKKFIINNYGNVGWQLLVVSIDPIVEFDYQGHTLKPPFIRQLNEFCSREITYDPFKIRIEKDGVGEIIQASDNSTYLYPISHQNLIVKIFELAGIKAEISPAGRLTSEIIKMTAEEMPLNACGVFKISGVRKLLKSLTSKESIKWINAIKNIGKENFEKFKKRYIRTVGEPELRPQDVFTELLVKKIFVPRLTFWHKILMRKKGFKCRKCGLESKVSLSSFEGLWRCPFCFGEQYLPSLIETEFRGQYSVWNFKKGSFFSKDNSQLGAIPVILSLMVFNEVLSSSSSLIYSHSLDLTIKDKNCEVDFVVLQSDRGERTELGIAECKDEHQKIDEKKIENLKLVYEKIKSLGIDCYIIFSKTADSFEQSEIELFKKLRSEYIPVIILTTKELEATHPYFEMNERDKLPHQYIGNMERMSENSDYLYLR